MSFLFNFFTISGVVTVGGLLGFVSVALLYRKYMDYLDLLEDDDVNEEDLDYEEKYYEDFCSLSTQELSDETIASLREKYVQELTPGGEVIMTYNHETESYHYWCNNRSIRYLTLDAVAQKFAIDHNCKVVCVDYNAEYEKAKQKFIEKIKQKLDKEQEEQTEEQTEEQKEEQTEEQTETTADKPKSVFASFKHYNTKDKEEEEQPHILPERTNRFSYRGKIDDWIEYREKLQEKDKTVKSIDFSTFKRMIATT